MYLQMVDDVLYLILDKEDLALRNDVSIPEKQWNNFISNIAVTFYDSCVTGSGLNQLYPHICDIFQKGTTNAMLQIAAINKDFTLQNIRDKKREKEIARYLADTIKEIVDEYENNFSHWQSQSVKVGIKDLIDKYFFKREIKTSNLGTGPDPLSRTGNPSYVVKSFSDIMRLTDLKVPVEVYKYKNKYIIKTEALLLDFFDIWNQDIPEGAELILRDIRMIKNSTP